MVLGCSVHPTSVALPCCFECALALCYGDKNKFKRLLRLLCCVQVITSAEFHPQHCNIFAYSSSKGCIRLADMRNAALCDRHAKAYEEVDTTVSSSFSKCLVLQMGGAVCWGVGGAQDWVGAHGVQLADMCSAALCDWHANACKELDTTVRSSCGTAGSCRWEGLCAGSGLGARLGLGHMEIWPVRGHAQRSTV